MVIVEILKLLTPSSPKMEIGSHSKDDLTPSDVAFALAKLPDHVSLFARVVYLQQGDEEKLINLLVPLVKKAGWYYFAPKRGKFKASEFNLRAFIALGLDESKRENRCRTCNGIPRVGSFACKVCEGSGVRRPSNRKRANFLKMDRRNFARRWQRVYSDAVLPVINQCEYELKTLRKWLK